MRKQKEGQMECLESEEVLQFFTQLGEDITSGRQKVWINKERGATEFIIGHERVRISTSKIRKGGAVCTF